MVYKKLLNGIMLNNIIAYSVVCAAQFLMSHHLWCCFQRYISTLNFVKTYTTRPQDLGILTRSV